MNLKEFDKILKEIRELIIRKNKMYDDENMLKIGEQGALIRTEDKIVRLRNLLKLRERGKNNKEEVEDNWKDIAGYGIIGLMLNRGKWKGKLNE